ncbi:MAG: hypothetical protein CMD29_03230 [Flavobacteriales bacterium]|nr:hypothetical protein [Flavobacteriales bacterium]
MDLIPKTKLKISKDKWLTTRIKYENDVYTRDIIELMCNKIYNWIHSQSEFELIIDYETFQQEFYQFFYDQYV